MKTTLIITTIIIAIAAAGCFGYLYYLTQAAQPLPANIHKISLAYQADETGLSDDEIDLEIPKLTEITDPKIIQKIRELTGETTRLATNLSESERWILNIFSNDPYTPSYVVIVEEGHINGAAKSQNTLFTFLQQQYAIE